jgi:hypothetical protein
MYRSQFHKLKGVLNSNMYISEIFLAVELCKGILYDPVMKAAEKVHRRYTLI